MNSAHKIPNWTKLEGGRGWPTRLWFSSLEKRRAFTSAGQKLEEAEDVDSESRSWRRSAVRSMASPMAVYGEEYKGWEATCRDLAAKEKTGGGVLYATDEAEEGRKASGGDQGFYEKGFPFYFCRPVRFTLPCLLWRTEIKTVERQ